MAKKRVPIPKRTERELLYRNQSVCCICQKSGVQIHHIDNDPSNNELNNLCVLCIEHHAHASSVSTMTKGLDGALLRKYKSEWEGLVLRRRRLGMIASRKARKAGDKDRLRFEIKKTVFSMPSMKLKTEFSGAFDYLYSWCLIEADRSDVINALDKVHWLFDGQQIKTRKSYAIDPTNPAVA